MSASRVQHASPDAPSQAPGALRFLDEERLAAISPREFREADPYPWINPAGLIRPEGYEILRRDLPELDLFTQRFGIRRRHGQRPHDRYTLEYHDQPGIAPSWREFIGELGSQRYLGWIREMFGIRNFFLTFHWHYTPRGCAVSPHCDAKRKLGSHIFYFNTADDWDPAWGGETLILDDGDRFSSNSAPDFSEFDRVIQAEALGNNSLLFGRRGNSWHGVRELTCPEDRLRKVFIVVINRLTPTAFAKRWVARWRTG